MIKTYGPYERSDGRKHVIIYNTKTGSRRTVSYPKWKYEKRVGIKLRRDQTIDHIDEDFRNNRLSNFQVLSRGDNIKKSVVRQGRSAKFVKLYCCWCGFEFKKLMHEYKWQKKNEIKYGFFCSKRCVGKFVTTMLN